MLAQGKVWWRRIGGISSWTLMSSASWTSRIIRSWSHNSFEMFESIRNDSKAGTLDAVRIEAERLRTASWSRVKRSFNDRKGKVFCILSWQAIKSGYTTRRRSWGKPGHTSTSVAKAKYPWFEASALHLMGSVVVYY